MPSFLMPRLNFSARSNGYWNRNTYNSAEQELKSNEFRDAALSLSYLLIRLVLCFSEEADVLDESRLDVFVVHKLAEDIKLLPQELVGKIHLIWGEGRKCFRRMRQTQKQADLGEKYHEAIENTGRQTHTYP